MLNTWKDSQFSSLFVFSLISDFTLHRNTSLALTLIFADHNIKSLLLLMNYYSLIGQSASYSVIFGRWSDTAGIVTQYWIGWRGFDRLQCFPSAWIWRYWERLRYTSWYVMPLFRAILNVDSPSHREQKKNSSVKTWQTNTSTRIIDHRTRTCTHFEDKTKWQCGHNVAREHPYCLLQYHDSKFPFNGSRPLPSTSITTICCKGFCRWCIILRMFGFWTSSIVLYSKI
jgi:hypothetical protein